MSHKHKHKKWDEFERETLEGIERIEEDLESNPPQPPFPPFPPEPWSRPKSSQGDDTMSTTTVTPTPPEPTPDPELVEIPATTTETESATPVPPAPAPPPTETLSEAVDQVGDDITSDIAATKAAVTADAIPLWEQARAEYDSLDPAAQSRIHTLLNDLEVVRALALPALHTFFGSK